MKRDVARARGPALLAALADAIEHSPSPSLPPGWIGPTLACVARLRSYGVEVPAPVVSYFLRVRTSEPDLFALAALHVVTLDDDEVGRDFVAGLDWIDELRLALWDVEAMRAMARSRAARTAQKGGAS